MKAFLVLLLFCGAVMGAPPLVTFNITDPPTQTEGIDGISLPDGTIIFGPLLIGFVTSNQAGPTVTFSFSPASMLKASIDFYIGSNSDCQTPTNKSRFLTLDAGTTALSVCLTNPPENVNSIAFITASSTGNVIATNPVSFQANFSAGSTMIIDNPKADVSRGSFTTTVHEASGGSAIGTLSISYGPGGLNWLLYDANACLGVSAAGGNDGTCSLTVQADPNAKTLTPGSINEATITASDGYSSTSLGVTYTAPTTTKKRDKVAVFSAGFWALDTNGNQQFDNPPADAVSVFGIVGDLPVLGDWDGTGIVRIGVFRNGEWYLDKNGSGYWEGPNTDTHGFFGSPGDIPVVGDWDGSGITKVGVFRNGEWHLDLSGTAQWSPAMDLPGFFGVPGDVPVVGDWIGDGRSRVGVYRNGAWHLDSSGTPEWNAATDLVGSFGLPGNRPVIGKW